MDNETMYQQAADVLSKTLDMHFKRCGLNADWSVEAWHVSKGEPNITDGDYYVTDNEDDTFSIVRRVYHAKDNDDIQLIMTADITDVVHVEELISAALELHEAKRKPTRYP